MLIGPTSDFIIELTKVLGLPPHVRGFSLTAKADALVEVECTYYPEEPKKGQKLLTERFNLVPVKKASDTGEKGTEHVDHADS